MSKSTTRISRKGAEKDQNAAARTLTQGTFGPAQADIGSTQKSVGILLMLAVEDDGFRFYVKDSIYEFFVPVTHPNYPAMFSQLLSAQGNGADVAVRYNRDAVNQVGNRRNALAVATGVNAIIIGASF